LLGEILGTLGDPDYAFTDHYASGSRRAGDIAGGASLVVAAIALVIFGAAVRSSLVDGISADVAGQTIGGAALVMAVVGGLFATTPISMSYGGLFDDAGQFDGGHAAVLPQAATVVLLVVVYPIAAVGVAAIALAARPARIFPRWHFQLSMACAALMPLAFFFLPILALPIWTGATAVALWRGPAA